MIPSGGLVFHRRRVKPGTAIARLRLAIDRSLSGEMTLEAAASYSPWFAQVTAS